MKVFISDDDMCTTQKLNLARVHKWFEANGCEVIDDIHGADHAICMTCNGWSLLEHRSYERIQKTNQHSNHSRVIVMGCVVDAHMESVRKLHSGPVVQTKSSRPLSFTDIEPLFPNFRIPLESIPAQSEFRRRSDYRDYDPKRVFLNIAEGCSFNCTFCTHKPGLANRRSRPMADILAQLEQRVRARTCDIVHIMGMETALWGGDVGSTFPALLREILDVDNGFVVLVGQFQPQGLKIYGDELVNLFSNKRVVDLQVPIQSTSQRIMKMMNRKEHSTLIGPMISEIAARNPRVILRTDVIVGWPSETKEEREASLKFACEHFDEVAVYAIELNADLPAWKYRAEAFSEIELQDIVFHSKRYVEERGKIAHSGQQDDASMGNAESLRKDLRERREVICSSS